MADYDAFLLVSFGGPEGPDDVMPFLQNVTRGRGIPPERLEAVARHYDAVGGVSPINQQCRDLITAIGKDFAAAGVDLPIYWGNRNWDPYLTETVAQMAAAGVRRALAFVTSAYGSYSSCRQYLDDIERARAEAGPGAPQIDKIRHFFSHPGFVEPFADATAAGHRVAAARGPPGRPARVHGAQRPGGHGGGQRAAARRPLPGAAGRGGQTHRGTRQREADPAGETPAGGAGGLRPQGSRAAGIPGGWSTRAAAGRPRSPGSALTSVTTWRNWPGMGRRARSWSRPASSPTIWRSCTTWTLRRPRSPGGSGCPWPGRPPPVPTRASCR